MSLSVIHRVFAGMALLALLCGLAGCGNKYSPDEIDGAARKASQAIEAAIEGGPAAIALLPIETSSGGSSGLTESLTDKLLQYLTKSNRLQVVEADAGVMGKLRSEMEKLFGNEYDENMAPALGRFVPQEYMVAGRISEVGGKEELSIRLIKLEKATIQVSVAIGLEPEPFFTPLKIGVLAGVALLLLVLSYLAKNKTKDIEPAPEASGVCSVCGEAIKTQYDVGGHCMEPTCDNQICVRCWNERRIRTCKDCSEKKEKA